LERNKRAVKKKYKAIKKKILKEFIFAIYTSFLNITLIFITNDLYYVNNYVALFCKCVKNKLIL